MIITRYFLSFLFFILFFLQITTTQAQDIKPDSIVQKIDSTKTIPVPDSLKSDSTRLDSLVTRDTTPRGDIQTTVNYSARDSILFSIDGRQMYLYGKAEIQYGVINLKADFIKMNWNTNMLEAEGLPDSTGKVVGKPVFSDGPETYQTEKIKYNFKTRKAFIEGVVTKQGEGLMHGSQVKKSPQDELFIKDAKYTTCNLAHPHFYISSKKIKVIPDDKVISGPFYLAVNDVPTPFGFPLAMFPAPQQRTSGIIFPSYGEERRRGFFLRSGGYYWAVNDYMNLAVTGDLYSLGSFGLNASSNYRKRYKYNGNMRFNFTNTKIESDLGEESVSRDFRISWNHTPQNVGGSGRFSMSVNAATTTFNQNNSLDVQNNITTTLNSSVSYSKSFTGTPFSMGLNGRFSQNLRTKEVNLSLPEVSFNMANVNPFLKKGQSPRNVLQKTVIKWSAQGSNRINNRVSSDSIAPFTLENFSKLFQEAQKGVRHSVPISTSFNLFKFFTFTPNLNYTERWYFDKLDFRYNNQEDRVETDTLQGFYRVYDFSSGISMSTRLYGTMFFNRGKIRAIRHVMNPSVSFSYRPDFSDPKFGVFQEVQTTPEGDSELRNRFQGALFGTPGQGRSGSIGFNVSNSLEMKVLSKKDTVKPEKKIPIFRNLRMGTAYNIYADQFKLSNISFGANTALFDNLLSLSITGNIDPYIYILNEPISIDANGNKVINQTRINEFAWNNGRGIGQLRSVTVSINTNLNPKALKTSQRIEQSNLPQEEKDFLIDNPDLYVDFNIPWSLRVRYSLTRSRTGFQDPRLVQSMSFSGDLSVTPKTKVTFNSGYDFERKEFTQTRLGITRNLHCWEMLFNWVPFGTFESFEFTIRVKSSILQDLQLNRRKSFFDNR